MEPIVIEQRIVGGYSKGEVRQKHRDIINSHTNTIASQLGIEASSFTINQVWEQVVNGYNYHFNLTSDNNEKCSVTIHVPRVGINPHGSINKTYQGHVGP